MQASAKDGPAGTSGPGTKRGVVWLVEDSPLEAEMARRALASIHDVHIFPEGSVVLERIANGELPEALVLDWELPGLTGPEICRFLRESRDEIELPVLMLTAYGHKTDILEALAAGANDYVTKPYDVTELLARVGALVRTSRLHEAQLRRERQLAMAADIGVALTQGGRPGVLLRRAAEAIVGRLGASLAAIWMVESDHLELATQEGPLAAGSAPRRVPLVGHPLGRIASSGARWSSDAPADEELLRGATWATERVATFAAYPLIVGGALLGLLVVLSGKKFSPDSVDSLGAAADVVALGLERARGEQERTILLERERKARSEAEAANRLKDEFLATVSHELRTPLNAIYGWARMLLDGELSRERTERALRTIERNARAQTQLIDDLLDVSRIISGKLRLETVPADLRTIVEQAIETAKPAADNKGVRVTASLDSSGMVVGDAARLQQVVWNILSNAVKFTPKGGTVEVRLRRVDAAVEVSVADSGQGISPEFLPNVFDRFRQADGTNARAHSGLGLGLAIARHLVELHGGQIAASSDGEGRGATFVFRVPITPPRLETNATPSSSPSPPASLACHPSLAGVRALIVDDEADARDLLTAVLERCQVVVTTASGCAEALESLEKSVPDVLLSDIGMPGEDGFSLMKRVRALPAARGGKVLAIALTAYARLDDRTQAMVAGFDMHLSKPIEPAELLMAVADLLERRAQSAGEGT